jgi:hypothetical protein
MRFALLWCLFFVICLGLGYPTLNRYDPARRDPDTVQYREMVIHGPRSTGEHFAHRLLIPYAASIVFKLAENRVGSWDAGYFGLLVVSAFFMSGAAAILFLVSSAIADVNVGLLASALYLLSFPVPNLFLIGFVDSGEAFFLMVLIWAAVTARWGVVPVAIVGGVLAKETFLPFAAIFCVTWAITCRSDSRFRNLAFTGIGISLGLAALAFAYKVTTGTVVPTIPDEIDLGGSKLGILFGALTHHDFWFAFAYLIPLGMASIGKMPKPWKYATAATTAMAVLMITFHASAKDAGPELVRPIFSIAGPLLTYSMALFIENTFRRQEK